MILKTHWVFFVCLFVYWGFFNAPRLLGINREDDEEECIFGLDQWWEAVQEPKKADLASRRLWEQKTTENLEYCFSSSCGVNWKFPKKPSVFSKVLMSSPQFWVLSSVSIFNNPQATDGGAQFTSMASLPSWPVFSIYFQAVCKCSSWADTFENLNFGGVSLWRSLPKNFSASISGSAMNVSILPYHTVVLWGTLCLKCLRDDGHDIFGISKQFGGLEIFKVFFTLSMHQRIFVVQRSHNVLTSHTTLEGSKCTLHDDTCPVSPACAACPQLYYWGRKSTLLTKATLCGHVFILSFIFYFALLWV